MIITDYYKDNFIPSSQGSWNRENKGKNLYTIYLKFTANFFLRRHSATIEGISSEIPFFFN